MLWKGIEIVCSAGQMPLRSASGEDCGFMNNLEKYRDG
jgi:hypothetical protein